MSTVSQSSSKPAFKESEIVQVLRDQYGVSRYNIDRIKPLVSYDDQNFYVKVGKDQRIPSGLIEANSEPWSPTNS